MPNVAHETDIRVVRQVAVLLENHNRLLTKKLAEAHAQLARSTCQPSGDDALAAADHLVHSGLMRWLPALIWWFPLPLVTTPALAVGGVGTLGALTNDGQGVGLPTTPIAVPTACVDRLDLEPIAAYCR